MQNNSEFNDVRKGLPNTKRPNLINQGVLIILHLGIGLILLFAFILAGFLIGDIDTSFLFAGLSRPIKEFIVFIDIILETSAYFAFLALIVGVIQGYILKGKIKSRKLVFSLLSISGGISGGMVGGLIYYIVYFILVDLDISSMPTNSVGLIWAIAGLIIGVLSGMIVGGVNSLLQNFVMNNSKNSLRWILYNLMSWSAVFGVGWAIGLGVNSIYRFPFIGDAIASMFIMVTHGIGIVIFLKFSPEIEFY